MSRLGRMAITIPKGVELHIEDAHRLSAKGPKGHLNLAIPAGFKVEREEDKIWIRDEGETKHSKMHGTVCRNAANLIKGVSQGFEKKIDLVGVGYKAEISGQKIKFELGYSHPIFYTCQDDIHVTIVKGVQLTIQGADKQKVGQTTAEIESLRKPEPYKGKGVRIVGKYLRMKEGKSKK